MATECTAPTSEEDISAEPLLADSGAPTTRRRARRGAAKPLTLPRRGDKLKALLTRCKVVASPSDKVPDKLRMCLMAMPSLLDEYDVPYELVIAAGLTDENQNSANCA